MEGSSVDPLTPSGSVRLGFPVSNPTVCLFVAFVCLLFSFSCLHVHADFLAYLRPAAQAFGFSQFKLPKGFGQPARSDDPFRTSLLASQSGFCHAAVPCGVISFTQNPLPFDRYQGAVGAWFSMLRCPTGCLAAFGRRSFSLRLDAVMTSCPASHRVLVRPSSGRKGDSPPWTSRNRMPAIHQIAGILFTFRATSICLGRETRSRYVCFQSCTGDTYGMPFHTGSLWESDARSSNHSRNVCRHFRHTSA